MSQPAQPASTKLHQKSDALPFTGAVAVRTLITVAALLTLAGLVMTRLGRSRESARN